MFSHILSAGKSLPMDWTKIAEWTPAQGLLWIHLDYANEVSRRWLAEQSGLDPVVREALLAEETRPRWVVGADSLLLILRGVNCNPGADPEDMVSIRIWLEGHRIISMRNRRSMAVDDINRKIHAGDGPTTTGEFLYMTAGRITDRISNVISGIDDSVDELEELVVEKESEELRPKLANLRRQTISLRRYISPQRDVLSQLLSQRLSWLTDLDRVRLREIAERTARFVDDLDSARDRAAITQEELNNHISERMNKTMYVLSIVAAIFLPLGLITGLLGINVGGIPGTENHFAFAAVCLLLVLFGVVQYLLFKRMKWL
ncbi:MAG: zinc transporter ZntB [Verrucomicrobiota bacterium JB025]